VYVLGASVSGNRVFCDLASVRIGNRSDGSGCIRRLFGYGVKWGESVHLRCMFDAYKLYGYFHRDDRLVSDESDVRDGFGDGDGYLAGV